MAAILWGIALLLVLLTAGWMLVRRIYPFLAKNTPIAADFLVIEGWMPDYAIIEAAHEFRQGHYQGIITLGPPLKHGYLLSEYKNHAELAAATLIFLGIEPDKIVALPVPLVDRDRTYTSALTLLQWLTETGKPIETMNLYSLGPHARRSHLLFRRALPRSIQIGVIAVFPQGFDPQRWWCYSDGVRTLLSETIGYVYVCLTRAPG